MAAHLLVVKLTASDEQIRRFLSDHPAQPIKATKEGDKVSVQIEMSADLLPDLVVRKIEHVVVYDATERGQARLSEVGRQRFAPGRPPLGLGKKIH